MKATKLALSFMIAFGFLFGLTTQKSKAVYLTGNNHPSSIYIVNLGNRDKHRTGYRRTHRRNDHYRRNRHHINRNCYSFSCGGHNYGASSYRRYSQRVVRRSVVRVSFKIRTTTRLRLNHTCMYGCTSHSYGGYYPHS